MTLRICASRIGFALAALVGCANPITTADQMREAILNDRLRDVRRAVANGFPVTKDIAYCFPLVPFAAATGRSQILAAVLDARPTEPLINQPNCMGHTALHFATMTNNQGLERDLVARGADLNARDHRGRTPEDLRGKVGEVERLR